MGHAAGHRKSVTVLTSRTPPSADLWLTPLAPHGQVGARQALSSRLGRPRSARRRAGSDGARPSLLTGLGHANTVGPSAGDTIMPADGREDGGGGAQGWAVMARTWGTAVRASLSQRKPTAAARPADAGPVRQMPLFVGRRICPSSADRPNGKAGCAATGRRCVERGKGCQALPLAPRVGKSGAQHFAGTLQVLYREKSGWQRSSGVCFCPSVGQTPETLWGHTSL
jgi:hypothetical protein